MYISAQIIVSGIVQGVGYRYFVLRLARKMELTGWVRNLPTGEVEIAIEGLKGLIESFIAELRTGNPYATVRNIDVQWGKYTGQYTGFDVNFSY
jgi:acylphosphatase